MDRDLSPYLGREQSEEMVTSHYATDRPPPPGQTTIASAALAIGILLMGIQLWLLTIALDLYLAGEGGKVWQLALASGAIFLGGLMITGLLRRRPRVRRGPTGAPYRSR